MQEAPPQNGTLTSRLAADDMVRLAPTLRLRVLQALLSAGEDGLTREQLEHVTALDGSTLRPRVWELMKDGTIREIPDRTRKTLSGRFAAILSAY